jgi:hypothetical protein
MSLSAQHLELDGLLYREASVPAGTDVRMVIRNIHEWL